MKNVPERKVAIVGGSAAGIYAAIFLKKAHPSYQVTILEKNDKLGKKILATGNGHCNLFNLNLNPSCFNHPDFMEKAFSIVSPAKAIESLRSLGVRTMEIGELVYPLSYSASTYVRLLTEILDSLAVEVFLDHRVLSYNHGKQIVLNTDHGSLCFDEVYFAFGGMSQPNLGSDGSLFAEIERHGYKVEPLRPSLCPVKTKEKTKSISGVRHKANVKLWQGSNLLYEENGEVIFKDDGLSGIAIFNCQSVIAQRNDTLDYRIELDLFPNIPLQDLCEDTVASRDALGDSFLGAYLEKPLKDYCLKTSGFTSKTPQNRCQIMELCRVLKALPFTYDGAYPFSSSQVTCGGVSLAEVDEYLQSKRERGVFFLGECLDIDGRCGGFNLGWALISAMLATKCERALEGA